MMFIALLILLGTLLVFLETVLVGGIWCAMGLACYGWAVWDAYSRFGTFAAVVVGAVSAAMCVAAFLVWLYVIPKTSLGKKLYLSTSQDGKAPSENMKPLIGRTATALTILVPTGKVEIDGLSYDARCLTSHVEAGERVTVEDANAFELKVKKI